MTNHHASDDIAQWAYPSVAVFSLWLSSFIGRQETKRKIKSKVQNETDKWMGICLEIRKSKEKTIDAMFTLENSNKKYYEDLIINSLKSAIQQLTPQQRDNFIQEAKIEALSKRTKEMKIELNDNATHIEYILKSRNSLERKVANFINQLREFHQDINRELKDNSENNNNGMWSNIDNLADKIFSEINNFNDYLSSAFINERMSREPMNRKTKNQSVDVDFSAPKKNIDKLNEVNNKKTNQFSFQL